MGEPRVGAYCEAEVAGLRDTVARTAERVVELERALTRAVHAFDMIWGDYRSALHCDLETDFHVLKLKAAHRMADLAAESARHARAALDATPARRVAR